MSKVFVIDVAKCNGCHSCQVACKDEHCGNDWSPIALPQPDTGQFWCKVDEKVRGSVPKVKVAYTPKLCNHCENAPCMAAAEAAGVPEAVYRRADGLVVVDPAKASGMRELVDACPFGAIYYNEELAVPQKCTGCAHLLDDGWEVPRCVDACATGAMRFGDEGDFADEIAHAEVMRPDLAVGQKVYYLNLPKRFVAGMVYDPEIDEVLIGAKVTLCDVAGAAVAETTTDEFGDFWFDPVEPAAYAVKVATDGYGSVKLEADASAEDVNVGMIGMKRA